MEHFTIPSIGVEGLTKNHFVEKLQFMNVLEQREQFERRFCDPCQTNEIGEKVNSINARAVKYCIECKEMLCDTCVSIHKKVTQTKKHKLLEPGDKVEPTSLKLSIYTCDKHDQSEIQSYCFDCRAAACETCKNEHKSHNCTDINECHGVIRAELEDGSQQMGQKVTQGQKLLSELSELSDDVLMNTLSTLESKIDSYVAQLHKKIDEQKARLVKELGTIKEKRIQEVCEIKKTLKDHLSQMELLSSYSAQLREKGTANEIFQQLRNLQTTRDGLLKRYDSHDETANHLKSMSVQFKAMTAECTNLVGKIDYTGIQKMGGRPTFTFLFITLCKSNHCSMMDDIQDIHHYFTSRHPR